MAFVKVTVARAKLMEVSVPLRIPFAISGGVMTHRRSLVVVLESDTGVHGFGEAAPFELPFYSAETFDSAKMCLRNVLIPRTVGATFDHSAQVREMLGHNLRGNRMARAAVDTAWWDLQARTQNVPLRTLVDDRLNALGCAHTGRTCDGLICGAALGIPPDEDIDLLLSQVSDAMERGFQRIKIKVRPGWSVKPLAAVRETLQASGAKLDVSVDANAAFHIVRDMAELRELDLGGAVFVEQPFAEEDIWDAAVWNRAALTPVCLDESLVSDEVARQVLEMGGPTVWNLKVQRLGGLEETCRVYARGAAAQVRMWIGTMPETGLGLQAALGLGGLPALIYPSDVGPSSWWFEAGTDLMEIVMDSEGLSSVVGGPGNLPKLDGGEVLAQWG